MKTGFHVLLILLYRHHHDHAMASATITCRESSNTMVFDDSLITCHVRNTCTVFPRLIDPVFCFLKRVAPPVSYLGMVHYLSTVHYIFIGTSLEMVDF